MTFADHAIAFNAQLEYDGNPLPPGIRIMNPFRENPGIDEIAATFYRKYYSDERPRHLILGINPSRLGAGLTGVPFTDPKRLISECHIPYTGKMAHEPSSVFVYEVIHAYGGLEAFYGDFYINSPCPLGFTSIDPHGNETNYNYYDSAALVNAVEDFMIGSLRKLLAMPIQTDVCFCFGTGKNEKYLSKLNAKYGFCKKLVALEHPRFVMQYKNRFKQEYVEKYLRAFGEVIG